MLLLFVFSILGCEKDEPPEFTHSSIDFSFADSIPGDYLGNLHINKGPIDFIEKDTLISFQVIDARTDKECRFYVDYFGTDIYLYRNFSFTTTWHHNYKAYKSQARFNDGKMYVTERYSSKYLNYEPFVFVGVKQ